MKQSEQRRGDTPDPVLFAIVAKSLIDQATAMEGKEKLIEIVSMCVLCRFHAVNVVKAQVGLIRSNSPSRDV